MSIIFVVILSIILFTLGYFFYGAFLTRLFQLNADQKTPAHIFENNQDFIPAEPYYLLGQHLSAIAAAGPIVGPILAGMWFGWMPTFVWIILGGILIGGVHDMATLVASIRHQGKSIAEVIKENIGRRAFVLFLLFLWFSLVYIITAFTDITSSTFVDETRGAGVASASMMYLLLAVIMGIILRLFPLRLSVATLIFTPMIFLCIYLGPLLPLKIPSLPGCDLHTTWNITLLIYCFLAAVMPVWLLLQPRGYLGGFFLTFTAGLSFLGIMIGTFSQHFIVQYPAFKSWSNPQGLPIFPILFTTVACGACSGFHCLISSGTTSKQLAREPDARLVGYGGMLLESFVAVIALTTLMILGTQETESLKDPNQIYANGIALFLSSFGINRELALNFALLAFATFVYDTLDVATRLGRYIFEELTGWRGRWSPVLATAITLILPLVFLTHPIKDPNGMTIPSWKIFWTVFGSSNQLLAAIVLLGLSLWLFRTKRVFWVTLLPACFMTVVAIMSLLVIIKPWILNVFLKGEKGFDPLGGTAGILLILAVFLIIEGLMNFFLLNRISSFPIASKNS